MPRTAALLLALLVAAPASLALGLALPAAPDAVVEHPWVEGFDGKLLRATWFQPSGPGPFPLVLRTHGWAQQREVEPTGAVGAFLDRGYAVLTWDSRGFGESQGLVELDSPDFEVKDVTALIDWALANKTLMLDAPGDPRVGMSGASYAGGIQLLAGIAEPRLDALAPEIAWYDLDHSLAPNGVLKMGWVTLLYLAGEVSGYLGVSDPRLVDRIHPNTEGVDPIVTRWFAESLAANRLSEDAAEGLAYRSLASSIDALPEHFPPVMFYQGWRDTLFTPNEAVWAFEALRARGFVTCLLVHGGGHGYATPDGAYVDENLLDFMDYYVLGTTAPIPPPIEVYQPWDQTWAQLGAMPGPRERLVLGTAAPLATGPLGTLGPDAGAGGLALVPATVAPAAFTEVPNFQEDLADPPALDPAAVVFATPPLAADRDVLGAPRLRLALAGPVPDAALFARVVDIAPDGARTVVGRQLTPVRIESTGLGVELDLELVAIAHRFEAGHRLGLSLSASDAMYLGSRLPLPVVVQADGASWLDLP